MTDRHASRQQLDLLVHIANVLEPSRMPPSARAEVTALLKLLISEHIAAAPALLVEAADD
jgi:hypothetical protein